MIIGIDAFQEQRAISIIINNQPSSNQLIHTGGMIVADTTDESRVLEELIIANEVNGTTGEYWTPPISGQQLVDLLGEEEYANYTQSVVAAEKGAVTS
ncbi:MAG: hypothetical protein GWN30_16790 [Gammaproteobacteria bacterium]|nr:hypothetical protein [Gammaproteobacteria bacterium]